MPACAPGRQHGSLGVGAAGLANIELTAVSKVHHCFAEEVRDSITRACAFIREAGRPKEIGIAFRPNMLPWRTALEHALLPDQVVKTRALGPIWPRKRKTMGGASMATIAKHAQGAGGLSPTSIRSHTQE